MYQYQEITDEEGKELAKQLNAIYKRTSAKEGKGIDDLFKLIGKKFLHPDSEITSNLTSEELKQRGERLRREQIKNNKKKNNCC